jgi:hypothetical protein
MQRRIGRIGILAAFAYASNIALAQAARISVGPNVHVSASRAMSPYNEVVIGAHPTDPRRLIVCSMLEPGANRSVKSAAWISSDGGRAWSSPLVTTQHWANDPTCVWGRDGTAYFVHKTNIGQPTPPEAWNSDLDFLGIERLPNGAQSWLPMIQGPQTNDRPFVAVDHERNALYVAYNGHVHGEENRHDNASFRNTVALMRSDDGGVHFTPPAQRALMDQTETAGSNAGMDGVVVMPDGSVAVLYTHMTLGPPRDPNAPGKPTVTKSALMLVRSVDRGATLQPALHVADVVSGYNLPHARGITATIAVDTSRGPHRGRLYVAWADFSTRRGQILVRYSDDAGKTWSASRAVNDDSSHSPPNGGPDHSMATIAVSPTGVVGVLWYDRRDFPNNDGYMPRFAASVDGGETFTPSVAISTAPNVRAAERGPGFLPNGGDTAGLTSAADGRFHAVWIDNRTGIQQVWAASIAVTAPPQSNDQR